MMETKSICKKCGVWSGCQVHGLCNPCRTNPTIVSIQEAIEWCDKYLAADMARRLIAHCKAEQVETKAIVELAMVHCYDCRHGDGVGGLTILGLVQTLISDLEIARAEAKEHKDNRKLLASDLVALARGAEVKTHLAYLVERRHKETIAEHSSRTDRVETVARDFHDKFRRAPGEVDAQSDVFVNLRRRYDELSSQFLEDLAALHKEWGV